MPKIFKFHEKEREIPPDLVDDMARILEKMYSTNKRLCFAVSVAYFTGARISEVISLRWEDIDPKAMTMKLERRAWNLPGTKGTKPGRMPKKRVVPYPEALKKLAPLCIPSKVGWIFHNEATGKHYRRETISRDLQSWCEKHMDYSFTFHELRHVFASMQIWRNTNPVLVSKILGHSDPKTTMIYTHFKEEDVRDGAENRQTSTEEKRKQKWIKKPRAA